MKPNPKTLQKHFVHTYGSRENYNFIFYSFTILGHRCGVTELMKITIEWIACCGQAKIFKLMEVASGVLATRGCDWQCSVQEMMDMKTQWN